MRKNPIIFILLFSLIFLLFSSGCQSSITPDLTGGTISGQAALPGSSSKDITGYTPIPGATVTVIDAQGNTHTTLTDENGFYSFDNIAVKANTIINIEKDTVGGGKIVFMEVIPQALSPEENFYAGIADAESTALVLVIEALINLGLLQEEIDLEEIISAPGFIPLEAAVRQAQENNQDIITLSSIIAQAEAIADYIFSPPPPVPTPSPTPAAVINIAAIPDVTKPATGATPATTITATAQYIGTVTWAPADDPFVGETAYTATITLTPKTGFTLTGVAANFFTVAGTSSPATNTVDSGIVTAVFPATAAAVIDIAAIPDVTVPATGATPVTEITETAQYTGTVTWAPDHSTFAGETVYTATITLTAKTGFTLTGVTENFFTVADATTDTNPANSGVVTAVFPETAAVINIAAIPDVTKPAVGATPAAITETDQYTGTVTWAPTDDPFDVGTYTAWITLTAKTGFTLTGVAANFFTVADAAATNAVNSGVVTAVFPPTVLEVGNSYGGGKVAYFLQEGETLYNENGDELYSYDANVQHGLIAATADQSDGIIWAILAYQSTAVPGGTLTSLGSGSANTDKIIAQNGGGTSYAAGLAKAYDGGDYDDWFLPSKYELNQLYLNKGTIGGFTAIYYWSSSETSANTAWMQNFSDGTLYDTSKFATYRVRAVRAF